MQEKEAKLLLEVHHLPEDFLKYISKPQEEDIICRQIFENQSVRCELVIAGKETRKAFPLANEFPIHVLKTNMGDMEYDARKEFSLTLLLATEAPGLGPMPIGFTNKTFRSEFINGQTIRSLSAPFPIYKVKGDTKEPKKPSKEDLTSIWQAAEKTYLQAKELHESGFTHGDLHMDNVIIDTNGNAKLIDFETLQEPLREEDYEKDFFNIKELGKKLVHLGLEPPTGPLKEAMEPEIKLVKHQMALRAKRLKEEIQPE